MKKMLLSFILMATLITGCAGNSGESNANSIGVNPGAVNQAVPADKISAPKNNAPEREYIAPEMKGEITVSTLEEWDFLDDGAKLFMDKYPDVKITVNSFRKIETIATADGAVMGVAPSEEFSTQNYLTLLNTKIMTGKAEDIIMTNQVPLRKYTEIGAFEDLSFFLSNSPEINEGSHYMNVFEIMKDKNGSLYEIPLTCYPPQIIAFNKTLTEDSGLFLDDSVKTMSHKEAVEHAKKLVDATDRANTFLAIGNSAIHDAFGVMNDNLLDFIDEENKKVDINNERFIGILNWAKDLENQGYYDTQRTIDFYNMEYYFALDTDFDTQAAYYALRPDTIKYHPMPMSDAKGNINANAYPCFGINSTSANKELAWEFIKFLLSDEFQTQPSLFGLGVNKKGFDANVERNLKMYNEGGKTNISKQEYEALIKGWVSQINSYQKTDPAIINELIYPELEKFFKEGQSAEDTARILQAKLDKYLNE